ncbi:MAG: hypothetical protein ACRDQX_07150 [Pseudonocardiaceae bacterium]
MNTAPEHGNCGRRVEYSIGWPVNQRTLAGIAQLRHSDWGTAVHADGEYGAFVTNTPGGQVQFLDARHLPSTDYGRNSAWLQLAASLTAWLRYLALDGDLAADTVVADLTGPLELGSWHHKIPGPRIIVRDEPPHPRYHTRATEREKQLGRRYQLIAINTTVGQLNWLDARHRSHAHGNNDVTQAKDLGLNRWPSRRWAINVA